MEQLILVQMIFCAQVNFFFFCKSSLHMCFTNRKLILTDFFKRASF